MPKGVTTFTIKEIAAVVGDIFPNSKSFLSEVEELVATSGVGYIEAIIHLCGKHGIELDAITGLIKRNPAFKAKLYEESKSLKLVKPEKTRGKSAKNS